VINFYEVFVVFGNREVTMSMFHQPEMCSLFMRKTKGEIEVGYSQQHAPAGERVLKKFTHEQLVEALSFADNLRNNEGYGPLHIEGFQPGAEVTKITSLADAMKELPKVVERLASYGGNGVPWIEHPIKVDFAIYEAKLLPPEIKKDVDDHLKSCTQCAYSGYSAVRGVLREIVTKEQLRNFIEKEF
jgi:hypothetical protein